MIFKIQNIKNTQTNRYDCQKAAIWVAGLKYVVKSVVDLFKFALVMVLLLAIIIIIIVAWFLQKLFGYFNTTPNPTVHADTINTLK